MQYCDIFVSEESPTAQVAVVSDPDWVVELQSLHVSRVFSCTVLRVRRMEVKSLR